MPPPEGDSSTSVNVQSACPFLSTPRNPLDQVFAWPYPFGPFDSGLWGWATSNYNQFIGQGPAFSTVATQWPWMMNPGSQSQEPLTTIPPPMNFWPASYGNPIEAQPETKAPEVIGLAEQGSGNDQQVGTQR